MSEKEMIEKESLNSEKKIKSSDDTISLVVFLANFSKMRNTDKVFEFWLLGKNICKAEKKTRTEWDSLYKEFYAE